MPVQWLKVKEIVGEALERDPDDRAVFLDRVCLVDRDLRAEVDSLLAASTNIGRFSQHPWFAGLEAELQMPGMIGPYRLEKELGTGGMGQVWLAEQTEPVRRRIALKLIRAGMYDSTLVERFFAERQSLALMNHPAIAKVFDAGTTAAGQPYFAMEYVDGLPITTYCNERKLGIAERLKLFLEVCEGVQHAHQKSIIHRDLKPSNILVEEVNGRPTPRIIDFGLAKSALPASPGKALMTQAGLLLGTPGYMSPEQAEPGMVDIDTRTDVYSLGVILYELLTGCLPFDVQHWRTQQFNEEPPRPSTKASHQAVSGTDARQLAGLLRGDLDWITLKALERNRERRYASPSDLAADIERHLESRPVKARPASRLYRLRKYFRRNRIAVGVCAAGLALLIAFAATQSFQLRRIRRERDRADRVTKFMTGMFKVSDPSEGRGSTISAREILDKGSLQITSELSGDPELQADLMETMGDVYQSLGLASRALPLIQKAAGSRKRLFGQNDTKTLASMDSLAWLFYETGHTSQAIALGQEIVDRRLSAQGADHPDRRKSMENLGVFFSEDGRISEAEKIHRELLAADLRTFGPDAKETLFGMNNLAADLIRERHFKEAQILLSQLLIKERRLFGPDHPWTLLGMNNLADVFLHIGQYAEAEKLIGETRDTQRRTLGPDHPSTAGSTYNLAVVAEFQGQRDKALALLAEAMNHGLAQRDALHIKSDDDLKSMRGDKRFQLLVDAAEKRQRTLPK